MKKKFMIIFSTLLFFTQLQCETEILEDEDDFKIVFDLEEIYPLVDYDTICTDYEIQDFIDNTHSTENMSVNEAALSNDILIPDLPQAPEPIAMIDIQIIEKIIPVPVIANDTQVKINTCEPKKKLKHSWFGKKKQNKNV